MLNLQERSQRAGSLLHNTLWGVGGVVAGAHRLVRPALRTRLTDGAAASAHPGIPQTLLPCAALDVLARLGLWNQREERRRKTELIRVTYRWCCLAYNHETVRVNESCPMFKYPCSREGKASQENTPAVVWEMLPTSKQQQLQSSASLVYWNGPPKQMETLLWEPQFMLNVGTVDTKSTEMFTKWSSLWCTAYIQTILFQITVFVLLYTWFKVHLTETYLTSTSRSLWKTLQTQSNQNNQ